MQKAYELTLIFKTSLTEDQQKKIIEEAKKNISSSGKVADIKQWGKQFLSYPIKKEKEGNYWLINFGMEGKEVTKITDKLKLNTDVLRLLLIVKE